MSDFALGKLNSLFGDIIDQIPVLGKGLGGLFGGGGGVSIPGTGGGIPGTGGGVGGAAAGAAGGLAGTVTAVGAVVSAVSGVISNFQLARQETTLNAIEESTRRSALFLGDRGDGGILGVQFRILEQLEFGNLVKAVEDFRNKWFDFGLNELRAISAGTLALAPAGAYGEQYFAPMVEHLERIEQNTRATAENTAALPSLGNRGTTEQLDELVTAVERNQNGAATRLGKVFSRSR